MEDGLKTELKVGLKVGFIGAGNIAQAMFVRWLSKGKLSPNDLVIYDVNKPLADRLAAEHNIMKAEDYAELIRFADVVVIAVKPNQADDVLEAISPLMRGKIEKIALSVVTGLSMDKMRKILPDAQTARVMPNTPAVVGEGVFAVSTAHTLREDTLAWTLDMLGALGRAYMVDEKDFPAVTGVSGSGPAYAFVMIEAMADAGVRLGLRRSAAYELAAQTLVGAGRMVLETGKNPAMLKDEVCSPGGTTIEAIYHLEKGGFRAAVFDAVTECAKKAANMNA